MAPLLGARRCKLPAVVAVMLSVTAQRDRTWLHCPMSCTESEQEEIERVSNTHIRSRRYPHKPLATKNALSNSERIVIENGTGREVEGWKERRKKTRRGRERGRESERERGRGGGGGGG
eukprot:762158-Hanusia_phi.AAC.3